MDVLAVGLGDDHHIGHLHNAALDALQFVARTGDLEHHEHIDHRMYGRFGLSHADRFDEDDVESGSFAQDDRFAGLRATPPSDPAEGEGRMKTLGLDEMLSMRVLSPRIEPPLRSELGSMASTASLCLSEVTILPTASMKVDFRLPGRP